MVISYFFHYYLADPRRNWKYSLLSLWLLWMPAFVAQLYYVTTHRCGERHIWSIFISSMVIILFYPLLLPTASVMFLWKKSKRYWQAFDEAEDISTSHTNSSNHLGYKVNCIYIQLYTYVYIIITILCIFEKNIFNI